MGVKQEIRRLLKKKWKQKRKPKRPRRPKINPKVTHKKKYHAYLKSKEWADIRIDLFNARGKKCEHCDSESNLQIHHLHYRNIFKEEPKDLVILCKCCHELEHKKPQPKSGFNENKTEMKINS